MRRPLLVAIIACTVAALGLASGVVAAETLVGGSVTIDADETVGDTSATGGTVVIDGTVDGDLRVYAGDVHLTETAEVTGIVRAYGGTATVDGSVDGNVLAYGGSVTVGPTADIDRSFGAVASDVRLGGRIGGDASVVAGSVTLAETALIEGNLNHVGELRVGGGTVEGAIQDGNDLALGPSPELFTTAFVVALFVGDLLLGAVLLRVAPRFADSAVETIRAEPVSTGAIGLAVVVGTIGAVAVLAVTIVGLPLAVGLLLSLLLLAWVARIYGQYAVGSLALSRTGYGNRYFALVVGVVGVTVLGIVPYLGTVVGIVVLGLGAGIVALGLRSLWRLTTEQQNGLARV